MRGCKPGAKNSNRCALVAGAILSIAIPLLAQQARVYREGNAWVEETSGTMPAGRELRVNTDLGSIQVQGNASGIAYVVRKRSYAATKEQAVRQFQMMKVAAATVGQAVILEGRLLHGNLNRLSADISMQVPRDLQKVRLDTAAGAMTVKAVSAALIGKTGAGPVQLDDISGPVTITTSGGDVVAGSLGSAVSIEDGGGSVHLDKAEGVAKIRNGGGKVFVGSAKSLTIENGAGAIEVQKCMGDLRATTGGGSLYLGDVFGSVHVDTGGGSVRLASAKGPVQVTTGGGSVQLFQLSRGAHVDSGVGSITVEFIGRDGFSDSMLRTTAGDISISLPSSLAVTVHASSDLAMGYGIRTAFPELKITKENTGYGPQSMWAEGSLNGGGPLLRVRTSSGHIDFRRSQ